MGKGDKKTRKGKIAIGSFGKTRPHHVKKTEPVQSSEKKATDEVKKPEKTKKPSA